MSRSKLFNDVFTAQDNAEDLTDAGVRSTVASVRIVSTFAVNDVIGVPRDDRKRPPKGPNEP